MATAALTFTADEIALPRKAELMRALVDRVVRTIKAGLLNCGDTPIYRTQHGNLCLSVPLSRFTDGITASDFMVALKERAPDIDIDVTISGVDMCFRLYRRE